MIVTGGPFKRLQISSTAGSPAVLRRGLPRRRREDAVALLRDCVLATLELIGLSPLRVLLDQVRDHAIPVYV